jgi:outer membrane lipoprotein LolB
MSRSWIAALALVLAVAACATPGLPPRATEAFDLSGRVSATSHDGRAFSSALRWQHLPERDEIWLLTPLGQALAHILSTEEGATVTGADRRQYQGADVEALTRQALGWELPLTRLQYWIRGEPAPGAAPQNAERDAAGRYAAFEQSGWRITLEHYAADQHGGLPRRLELRRDGGETIRLIIDAWRSSDKAAP